MRPGTPPVRPDPPPLGWFETAGAQPERVHLPPGPTQGAAPTMPGYTYGGRLGKPPTISTPRHASPSLPKTNARSSRRGRPRLHRREQMRCDAMQGIASGRASAPFLQLPVSHKCVLPRGAPGRAAFPATFPNLPGRLAGRGRGRGPPWGGVPRAGAGPGPRAPSPRGSRDGRGGPGPAAGLGGRGGGGRGPAGGGPGERRPRRGRQPRRGAAAARGGLGGRPGGAGAAGAGVPERPVRVPPARRRGAQLGRPGADPAGGARAPRPSRLLPSPARARAC